MSAVTGWKHIKIRDIFASSMPGDWGKDGSPEDGIPVLRSTNFRNNGSIDYSDIAYRKVEEVRLNKRRIKKGKLIGSDESVPKEEKEKTETWQDQLLRICGIDINTCPVCKKGSMVMVELLLTSRCNSPPDHY